VSQQAAAAAEGTAEETVLAGSAAADAAPEDVPGLDARERHLYDLLGSFDSLIVAFSGGVDSAFLGWAATRILGPAAICITADSPSYPDHHRQLALRVAREFGLHHEIIHTAELERPEYRANPVDRCYHCKHELYTTLSRIAGDRGIAAIADGTNADDRGDYRPGRRAAREYGVRSPLDEAGLSKADIRELSRRAGLPTWDEPASACLSSRIPYHSEVTSEKLQMIERAEEALRRHGFRVCRVRHHDLPAGSGPVRALARLELGRDELPRALEPAVRAAIVRDIRAVGYAIVTIDLEGYRSGSLNAGVALRPILD
jgi:uncharacterized protein